MSYDTRVRVHVILPLVDRRDEGPDVLLSPRVPSHHPYPLGDQTRSVVDPNLRQGGE